MGTFDNIHDLLETIESQKFNYHLVIIEVEDGKEKLTTFTSLDKEESKKLLKSLTTKPIVLS
jgi:hypothetical protein